jgi:PIN domain nuclease of toxin-antitoxin system
MVLLDTCVLIWLVGAPSQLSLAATKAITEAAGAVCVSAISAWEIAVKSKSGKLVLPKPVDAWYSEVMEHHGLIELPITGRIAMSSAALPPHYNDPADRLLIATAVEQDLSLITPDLHISQYAEVRSIW